MIQVMVLFLAFFWRFVGISSLVFGLLHGAWCLHEAFQGDDMTAGFLGAAVTIGFGAAILLVALTS